MGGGRDITMLGGIIKYIPNTIQEEYDKICLKTMNNNKQIIIL